MATVQKRGMKWYAIFTDHQGRQRQKSGYTDKTETIRLANRLEDEARRIRLGDVDPQADARRIERAKPANDHLASFKAHMASKKRHPKHIAYTAKDVERCFAHAGITSAAQLTLPQVDAWRSSCLNTGYPEHHDQNGTPTPDSRKTANRRIASVRAFLRFLHRIGAVERVVTDGYELLDTKGHETKQRRALSADESRQLLASCPDVHRREIYRFALLTGFRRSEIASMTPASFDFSHRTITVLASDAKHKGDHQIIPMHKALIVPLTQLCQGKEAGAAIFTFCAEKNVVKVLLGDCKEAGIDTTHVDFHALRHTYISGLAEQNIRPEILMKLARHRQLQTTLRYYVHFRPDDERAAIDRL